ncbi:MAG: hypothetical protein JXA66_01990, partial [Oligoflexia bacterium]|nr:hypothetical protein [Oligoflexia bacterium]
LLDNLTTNPELIDIHKFIKELNKESVKLKTEMRRMQDGGSISTCSRLNEKIVELAKDIGNLKPESKAEIYNAIDKSHILLNELRLLYKNDRQIEKIIQLMFHHLEAIYKYVGMAYSDDEDQLQILLEILHYENKLLDGLSEGPKTDIESIFMSIRNLMTKIKEIINSPDDDTLDTFNKYKWDINSNIAMLIDIRDDKISDFNMKNLISKNIVSISTYLQKAKRELYKNMNNNIVEMVLEEPDSKLVDNGLPEEVVVKEARADAPSPRVNYSDTTIKVLKTLLPQEEQGGTGTPEEMVGNLKKVVENQDKEIKKLNHELDMLTYKIEEQDVMQTMIINENRVQLSAKALEAENESLKTQILKLNDKGREARNSIIQLMNMIKEKDTALKKANMEINSLNNKIGNLTRQAGLLTDGDVKPQTLIEHKMKETEEKLKRANAEYRTLFAQYGKLSQSLNEERIRSKRLNMEVINAEQTIKELKNQLFKNKKVA